jgi:hypothetical protein
LKGRGGRLPSGGPPPELPAGALPEGVIAASDRRYLSLFEQKYQRGEIASVPDHGVCPVENIRRGDFIEVELYSGGDILGFLGMRVRDRLGMQHGGPAYEVHLLGASTPQAMA